MFGAVGTSAGQTLGEDLQSMVCGGAGGPTFEISKKCYGQDIFTQKSYIFGFTGIRDLDWEEFPDLLYPMLRPASAKFGNVEVLFTLNDLHVDPCI